MRPGLRAERGAQSAAQRCAFQFVRLWRNQWVADLQEVDGIRTSPLIYTDRINNPTRTCEEFAASHQRLNPMLRFCRQLPIACFLLALTSLSAGAQPRGQTWSAQWEPVKLVNGSPVLFRVTAPKQVAALAGNFLGQDLSFRSSQSCHCWYALAGVSLA